MTTLFKSLIFLVLQDVLIKNMDINVRIVIIDYIRYHYIIKHRINNSIFIVQNE